MGCSQPKLSRTGLRNILAFLKVELQHFLGGTRDLLRSAQGGATVPRPYSRGAPFFPYSTLDRRLAGAGEPEEEAEHTWRQLGLRAAADNKSTPRRRRPQPAAGAKIFGVRVLL